MKRQSRILIFLLAVMITTNGTATLGAVSGELSAYYPMKPGNRWNFNQIYQNKIQVKISIRSGMPVDGNLRLNVYSSDGPDGTANFFRQSQYFTVIDEGILLLKEVNYNGDVTAYNPPQPVLKADMSPGSSWDWQSDDQKTKQTSKILPPEQLTIQGKVCDAVVVQTDGVRDKKEKYANRAWFVKNVGMVKQTSTVKGKTYTFELTDFTIKN